jgi:transcriptional regulator with XRE-family HTH domain
MKSKVDIRWEPLAESMRNTFAQNLTAALNVAGEESDDSESRISRMTQEELHQKTRISKSTLSKLMNGKTNGGMQSNPDLETICRIAASINIPPAFLLMSGSDWQRLIGALNGLSDALSHTNLENDILIAKGNDKIKVGIELAKKLGLYSENAVSSKFELEDIQASEKHEDIKRDIANKNEIKRLAILTTTAVLQNSARNLQDTPLLTAMGVILGANFKLS